MNLEIFAGATRAALESMLKFPHPLFLITKQEDFLSSLISLKLCDPERGILASTQHLQEDLTVFRIRHDGILPEILAHGEAKYQYSYDFMNRPRAKRNAAIDALFHVGKPGKTRKNGDQGMTNEGAVLKLRRIKDDNPKFVLMFIVHFPGNSAEKICRALENNSQRCLSLLTSTSHFTYLKDAINYKKGLKFRFTEAAIYSSEQENQSERFKKELEAMFSCHDAEYKPPEMQVDKLDLNTRIPCPCEEDKCPFKKELPFSLYWAVIKLSEQLA